MGITLLGRQKRQTAGALEFGIYGFHGGLNVKAVPQMVGDDELTTAYNVYLTQSGGVRMRNGMTARGTAIAGAASILGLARFYQTIKNGVSVSPATQKLLAQAGDRLWDYDNAVNIGAINSGTVHASPWTCVRAVDSNDPNFATSGTSSATSSTSLTDSTAAWATNQFANSIVTSGSSSATVISNTATVLTVASWTGGTPSTGAYTVANNGQTDVIVICTGSGGPYIYDGVNLYTPAGWSAAKGASWCAQVNGIVWFGGIPAAPRQVYGTGDGSVTSFETLPAFNNFEMTLPVTGLCAMGTGATASLVIGMQNGLTILFGTGINSFYRQDVPGSDGVTAGRTMTGYTGSIFYLGRLANYAFNQQSVPVSTSDNVEPWIQNDGFIGPYQMTGYRNLSWSQVYNNRLHIGYCTQGSATPNAILVLDLIVGGWTILQSTPGLYCMALLDGPSDPSPAAAVVGSTVNGQVYNWDIEPTLGTAATDAGTTIPAAAATKYFPIGVPGTDKALMRTYPEMYLTGSTTLNWTASTDYGAIVNQQTTAVTGISTGGLWDVGLWDVMDWGGGPAFTSYGPPASRVDWDETRGNTFSFGVATSGNAPPWIFGGLSGTFQQLGRSSAS